MPNNTFDTVVIGAGHAGVEAALACARIDRRDLPEGIVRLCVDKIEASRVQRCPEIVIKRIGVEIPMDAGDVHQHRIRPRRVEQRAVQHAAAPRGDVQLFPPHRFLCELSFLQYCISKKIDMLFPKKQARFSRA